MSKFLYEVQNAGSSTFLFENGQTILANERKVIQVEEDSAYDDYINTLIANGSLILFGSSNKKNTFSPTFSDKERQALQYMVALVPITNITVDGVPRYTGFTEGGVDYTISYLSDRIVVAGGGQSKIINLDGSGRPTSMVFG